MADTTVTLPTLLSAGSLASIDNYISAIKANGDINAALALASLSKAIFRIENALRTSQSISIPVPAAGTPGTPAGDVSSITVSGSFDPISGYGTISVAVAPPAGTFDGCHLFIEIPDGSGASEFTLGTSDLSGSDAISGQWNPVDLERQPYVAAQQPWTVTFPIPPGLDLTQPIPCRLYAPSYTTDIENALVQAGQPGASPNQTFTLTPRVANVPASGTNVTENTGPIVATALTPDNSTGKLKTPVYVIIGSAPTAIPGWVGQLVLTYGSADPTQAANQFPVGPIFNTAGPVNAGHDGITVPHSFAVDTPNTVQTAVVWARTGRVDASGNYQWNNIIPGITPSFPITLGTTTGTVDAASILLSSFTSTMSVVANQFGVATGGIATLNIQNLAITNPLLASLAVDAAKLATGAVTATKIAALAVGTAAIQLLAVDNTIIANASVSAAKIVSATITSAQIASATIVGANIANATILDANIATLSASKITAGTISASISITAPNITSTSGTAQVTLNNGQVTCTDSSLGISGLVGGLISGALFAQGTYTGVPSSMACNLWELTFNVNSTNKVAIGAFLAGGSYDGYVKINGTQVLSTRVGTTPVTLADVIAVLQHHGLSN